MISPHHYQHSNTCTYFFSIITIQWYNVVGFLKNSVSFYLMSFNRAYFLNKTHLFTYLMLLTEVMLCSFVYFFFVMASCHYYSIDLSVKNKMLVSLMETRWIWFLFNNLNNDWFSVVWCERPHYIVSLLLPLF